MSVDAPFFSSRTRIIGETILRFAGSLCANHRGGRLLLLMTDRKAHIIQPSAVLLQPGYCHCSLQRGVNESCILVNCFVSLLAPTGQRLLQPHDVGIHEGSDLLLHALRQQYVHHHGRSVTAKMRAPELLSSCRSGKKRLPDSGTNVSLRVPINVNMTTSIFLFFVITFLSLNMIRRLTLIR